MYEFDEQPSRVVAESDLLSMRGHVLISQDLRRFDTVVLSSHGCNQNSDAVCGGCFVSKKLGGDSAFESV